MVQACPAVKLTARKSKLLAEQQTLSCRRAIRVGAETTFTRTCGCLATSEDVSARCIGMKPSPGAVMAVAAKPTELRVRMLFCACINFLQGQNENTHQNDDSGRKFHDQALLGGIVVIMASAISEGIAAGPRLSLIIGHGYGTVSLPPTLLGMYTLGLRGFPSVDGISGRRSDDITDVCMAKPRGNVGAGSGGAARSDTPCRAGR